MIFQSRRVAAERPAACLSGLLQLRCTQRIGCGFFAKNKVDFCEKCSPIMIDATQSNECRQCVCAPIESFGGERYNRLKSFC
ncbi:MAG: hypothetical protein COA78_01315 [Blastopirellula sp.]|nr:MAG: hypothetical protein COA78_01315 [Blastopirellula sp.]